MLYLVSDNQEELETDQSVVIRELIRVANSKSDAQLLSAYTDPERSISLAYTRMSVRDLRDISAAVGDEAMLRVIAENQDRLERFINDDDEDDPS